MKTCSCGQVFKTIPLTSRVLKEGRALDGYYWNCKCGSTLFQPLFDLDALLKHMGAE